MGRRRSKRESKINKPTHKASGLSKPQRNLNLWETYRDDSITVRTAEQRTIDLLPEELARHPHHPLNATASASAVDDKDVRKHAHKVRNQQGAHKSKVKKTLFERQLMIEVRGMEKHIEKLKETPKASETSCTQLCAWYHSNSAAQARELKKKDETIERLRAELSATTTKHAKLLYTIHAACVPFPMDSSMQRGVVMEMSGDAEVDEEVAAEVDVAARVDPRVDWGVDSRVDWGVDSRTGVNASDGKTRDVANFSPDSVIVKDPNDSSAMLLPEVPGDITD